MVAGPPKNEDVSRTLDQYDLARVGNNMHGLHTAYCSALEFCSNISPRRLNILIGVPLQRMQSARGLVRSACSRIVLSTGGKVPGYVGYRGWVGDV